MKNIFAILRLRRYTNYDVLKLFLGIKDALIYAYRKDLQNSIVVINKTRYYVKGLMYYGPIKLPIEEKLLTLI